MSLFLFNKTFLENMDKHGHGFFWHGKKLKKVTIWPNGAMFADPKRKVVQASLI
jgi:hypothetical protein